MNRSAKCTGQKKRKSFHLVHCNLWENKNDIKQALLSSLADLLADVPAQGRLTLLSITC